MMICNRKLVLVPAPKVDAKDTTAAGDVFNGGLAVAISEGLNLASACRFANYAAALSVTRLGAQAAVPSRQEVDQFLAGEDADACVIPKESKGLLNNA